MSPIPFARYKASLRKGISLLIALGLALVLGSFSTGTASAMSTQASHKPLFKNGDISSPGQALLIPDPAISWAVYASLDHPNEADYFSFHGRAGLPLDAQITIPALPSLQPFAPHLALIGPGLPSSAPGTTFFPIPAGDGIQIVDATHAGTGSQFNEPFTQTTYWNRQTLKEPLKVAGTYYLVVFNRPADTLQTGKYVLAVGDTEQFGPADLVTFPATYFHVRFFTGAGLPLWSWVGLGIVVLLILAILWRRQRRRTTSTAKTEAGHP